MNNSNLKVNKIEIYKKLHFEKEQLFEKGIPGKIWIQDYCKVPLNLEILIKLYIEIIDSFNSSDIIFSIYIPVNFDQISEYDFIGISKPEELKSRLFFNDTKLTLHDRKIKPSNRMYLPLEFHRYDISSIIETDFPDNIKCMYFEVKDLNEYERYIMIWDEK